MLENHPTEPPEEIPTDPSAFLGEHVVVDTKSSFFFAGRLVAQGQRWITLEGCDMHDHQESNSTREVYIMDVARYGIRENRARVLVRLDDIVAISRLSDIRVY